MSKLVYFTNASLDGYIEDETGAFNWMPADDVHSFITELVRPIGTHLYGRRLYETMAYWDAAVIEGYPPEHREFARVWQKAEKIVVSRTRREATTRNTRVEGNFDIEARELKGESEHDLFVGGAELAAVALEADLVDDVTCFSTR